MKIPKLNYMVDLYGEKLSKLIRKISLNQIS